MGTKHSFGPPKMIVLFVYKHTTGEFNMSYALLSLIQFVATYTLLGSQALTINSRWGDEINLYSRVFTRGNLLVVS